MRVLLISALVAGAWLSVVVTAQAQARGDRGLFGGGVGGAEQVLSVSSSLGATYYESLTDIPLLTTAPLRFPGAVWTGQASAQLSYALNRPHLQIQGSLGRSATFFPQPEPKWFAQTTYDLSASTSRSWALSRRARLSLSQTLSLRPAYWAATSVSDRLLSSLAGGIDPALILPPDLTHYGGKTLGSGTEARLSYGLTSRLSVDATYGLNRRWDFDRGADAINLFQQFVSVGTTFSVTRHLSVRGGYRFADSRNGPAGSPHVRTNNADFGVNYDRGGTIRLSRKTTLSFTGGLAAFADSNGRQRTSGVGSTRLSYQIGRTWAASAGAGRSVDFSSLFQEPVLSDTLSADLGGLIARRLSFRSVASYSRGTAGFNEGGNQVILSGASVTLQAAMTRYLALSSSYGYSRREIGDRIVLPSGLSPRSEDQVFSVYLSAWAPLYQRTRRSNATR